VVFGKETVCPRRGERSRRGDNPVDCTHQWGERVTLETDFCAHQGKKGGRPPNRKKDKVRNTSENEIKSPTNKGGPRNRKNLRLGNTLGLWTGTRKRVERDLGNRSGGGVGHLSVCLDNADMRIRTKKSQGV